GVALLIALRRRRRRQRGHHAPVDEGGLRLEPRVVPLAAAAAAVPLLVFGTLSLGLKVEANWSAMYVFGAAALLAPFMSGRGRLLAWGCLGNVVLLLIAHAHFGILPTRPHKDRMLAETHGYGELAAKLAKLDGPVFADSYQITAMTT